MAAPTITPLPDPPTLLDDPETFAVKASAFVAALVTFQSEVDALGDYLDNLSLQAASLDSSTTSIAFGTGSKVFTVTAGKAFAAGQFVTISDSADPASYMFGRVTSYAGTTLTVTVLYNFGAGTIANWLISVVPPIFDLPILNFSATDLRYKTGIM